MAVNNFKWLIGELLDEELVFNQFVSELVNFLVALVVERNLLGIQSQVCVLKGRAEFILQIQNQALLDLTGDVCDYALQVLWNLVEEIHFL